MAARREVLSGRGAGRVASCSSMRRSSDSGAPCRARPSSASSAQVHSSSTATMPRGDKVSPPPSAVYSAPSTALAASLVAPAASAALASAPASAVTPSRCVAAMSSARCATMLTRAGCVCRARKLAGPPSRLEIQRTPWWATSGRGLPSRLHSAAPIARSSPSLGAGSCAAARTACARMAWPRGLSSVPLSVALRTRSVATCSICG